MNNSNDILKKSVIAFGTSGARGLVTDFTPEVCAAYTHAFSAVMQQEFEVDTIAIAIDNRPSSYAIAQACAAALIQRNIKPIYYGVIPTPALAYKAMLDAIPCIMVTGSHIPFDRNGLKFYRPDGEITKADEKAILSVNVEFENITHLPDLVVNQDAAIAYTERYLSLFNSDLLKGKRIGIYEHSSAGRDIYASLFSALGAEVIRIGRSDDFIPIDTEAVADVDKAKARIWSREYNLDMIFSTDGDGDRPLVADDTGEWLRGDILGMIAAEALAIEALAIPVSCNTLIVASDSFKHVALTKIGSPYVIEQFTSLQEGYQRVAGFEANGGFLLGSDISLNGKDLLALPTRDALLPALMLLAQVGDGKISSLLASLPKRYTYSDRLKNFSMEKSQSILISAKENPGNFILDLGLRGNSVDNVDITDGLRIKLDDGNIIHLRPSGNAPELRCYAEADTVEQAQNLVCNALQAILKM
ncbi:phosphomannomutase [Edwardsiella tarda]|uniref:phosphomannomutase n=1 Tax=Edwardsiella tarda TaxID=636 RepID=UPI000D5131EA|nr:phosphomannomutase [Edwardsiella tarda]UCQ10394.1 phosphomannomutase [Edwardsiella tarda]